MGEKHRTRELRSLTESDGFSIAKLDSPPRLYVFLKSLDQAEADRYGQALRELSEEAASSVVIIDCFELELQSRDLSLQKARDALVEAGVRNIYRVGPFENLCKVIKSLEYESRYNAYFTLSYGELNNLLRLLNR